MNFTKHHVTVSTIVCLTISALTVLGQTQESSDVQELPSDQTVEREMTGAETHRYKIVLKANEFFQVRVEQKGVDVALKLTDASGRILASMDSPNGKEGPETLSFVANLPGNYALEVSGFESTAEKGSYTIRREASRTAMAQDRRRVEVERVFVAGMTARDSSGEREISIKKLEEARMGWQELNDAYLSELTAQQVRQLKDAPKKAQADSVFAEARTLADEGSAESMRASLPRFNEAWSLYREIADKQREASCLGWLGNVHSAIGEKQKALEFYNLALSLIRAVGDRAGEARTLNNIGLVYGALGEKQKALESYNLALPLTRAVGNKSGEANTLNNIGAVYSALGEKQRALEFYNLALPLKRVIGDRGGEATTLNNIGLVNDALGEKQKALEFYNLALPLWIAVRDRGGEATTLNNIGAFYSALGEKQKALEFYNLALPLIRTVGDKGGEAGTLNNIGLVYDDLGEKQKALEFYNLALPLIRAVGNRSGEANTLNNIGAVYSALGEKQRALEFYNLALPLKRAVGDSLGVAYTLNNIGSVYDDLSEKQKALEFYNLALPLWIAVGDRRGEATTLNNIGGIHNALGEKQKALEFYNLALPLKRAVGDRRGEATTLGNVMYVWESLNSRRMAIFYGKQSVNKYQELRQAVQGLGKETQQTYLNKVEPTYRKLAGILIAENRLDEATQVINLLRDQEFFDFNRDVTQPPRKTVLTAHESASLPVLQAALDDIVSAEQPLTTLKRNLGNRKATTAETSELKRREADFEKATANFRTTLKIIETDFNQPASAKDKVENVPDTMAMQSALRELGNSTKQKAAALYTLIGEDKFHVILIQADEELRSFESPIKAADLNKKTLQFYALLRSPAYDARPLGRDLYDILFEPVETELKKAGVRTLMWQLDGNLRYVPMAALFDGKEYLVEHFQSLVFTRANRERMTRNVSQNWTGTGFGSSKPHTVDLLGDGVKVKFRALPGVTAELAAIFRTRSSNGILSGDVLIDSQFTMSAFYDRVRQRRPLVHISSHFAFRPGDDSRSFLLLGDGKALTLNELKKEQGLFDGLELLTLSACNTAAQRSDATGREIDGFAELAQRLGAGAVIATLWSVSDNSTPYLMRDFYRVRQLNAGTTKTAALRQAQLALLNGTARVKPDSNIAATKAPSEETLRIVLVPPGERSDRDRSRDTGDTVFIDQRKAPLYHKDVARPYAHPYYWSPFVLYGNWR